MKQRCLFGVVVLMCVLPFYGRDRSNVPSPVATFSIVAIDPATGDLGVAVASRYFSVGAVVPWAEAGVGAVATQANVNVGYGPRALELLKQGLTAQQTLEKLLAEDPFPGKNGRQVCIVDAKGNIATYTGPEAPPWAGHVIGKTWSAQGNILTGPQVLDAMGKAFEATHGELAEKLYAALEAGERAGGDARGRQSASMLIVRKQGGRNLNNDRYVYINVDDHPNPLIELRRLLNLNLYYLGLDRAYKLLNRGQFSEAKEAAAKAVTYAPEKSEGFMTLGLVSYLAGDKPGALRAFLTAKALDPNFQRDWEALSRLRAAAMKVLLEDQEFLRQLFGSSPR